MIGNAFYFHFGLVARFMFPILKIFIGKKFVFYDLCFLCFNLTFCQFPHLDPTYIVKVNVKTKDTLESVKQIHRYTTQ